MHSEAMDILFKMLPATTSIIMTTGFFFWSRSLSRELSAIEMNLDNVDRIVNDIQRHIHFKENRDKREKDEPKKNA